MHLREIMLLPCTQEELQLSLQRMRMLVKRDWSWIRVVIIVAVIIFLVWWAHTPAAQHPFP